MKNIAIFFLLTFLFSCTSNTIFKKPKDLIPKDTMENLILEMTIASSAKYSNNKNLERNINYMPLVFDKYQIDSARFERSNVYYTSKIDDYKKMLENVSLRLETIKKEFTDKKNVKDSMRRDSVKLVKNIPILKLKEELDTNKKYIIKTKTIMEFLEEN